MTVVVVDCSVTASWVLPDEVSAAADDLLGRLPIAVASFDRATQWPITYAVARRFNLTFYDACYVRLAKAMGAPLMTFDGKMREAARGYGVEDILGAT